MVHDRPLAWIALAALALTSLAAVRRTRRDQLAARPMVQPTPLQTWEGEGGGLPDGGPGPEGRAADPQSSIAR
jgi:hypothetical protein